MKSTMKNSTTMMKRLLNLKEDYTLELNESDETSTEPVEVEKPLNGDVGGWVQVWKNTIETFTKNLFLQTLQQWLGYKQGTNIQQETIDGIELLAKEYNAEEQAVELLKSKVDPGNNNSGNTTQKNNNPENQPQKNTTQQGTTPLKESENSGESQPQTNSNQSQENTNTENATQENTENQSQENTNTESQNHDGEEISDAEAMAEVLKNLPVLVQDNLTSLVSDIEGVKTEDIPKNEPQPEITDLEVLKNYLTKLTDDQDLQNAFNVFENRIKDIQPKPVDEEKLTQVKDHFKIKDDYLDEIEKSWKNYMKAVNNNSETSMLLEMKNLLNAVHNFNKNGKTINNQAPTQDEPKTEENQETQPENNSEGNQE